MKKSDVIAYFGSRNKVAAALGITRVAVSTWPEIVPRLRQYELEELTGGKLKADRRELPAQAERKAARA